MQSWLKAFRRKLKMRKDFYVFRHGETDFNRDKRTQGSGYDLDINETGRRQACDLAVKLENMPLEVIFSSPLKRALHTAEIVAQTKDIPLNIRDDLRECSYGDAEGMPIDEVKHKFGDIYVNWHNPEVWDISYPKGETKIAATERVWKHLELLLYERYDVMGVAIHAGTMGCLLNRLNFNFEKIPNCAVFHLVYDNGDWLIEGDLF